MQGFSRIAAGSPRLHLGDPLANAGELAQMACAAADRGVEILAFPELALTGYTCGDLFFRQDLPERAEEALARYARETSLLPLVAIVGFPERCGDCLYNAAAVVSRGEIVGIVRKRTLANYAEYYERRQFDPAPAGERLSVFEVGGLRFAVEICEDLWSPVPPSSRLAGAGLDAVFNLSASTDFLGKAEARNSMVLHQSRRLGCAYAMAAAGPGESTSDAVYGGGSVIAAGGRMAAAAELFAESSLVVADVDVEALRYRRRADSSLRMQPGMGAVDFCRIEVARPLARAEETSERPDFAVSPHPFMDEYGEPGWVEKLLTIQSVALARRMRSARARNLVIGVSGGADSALALLGSVRAARAAGGKVIAVVMPGMASTSATQSRAEELSAALGAEVRRVDICDACRRHLLAIGHDGETHDIAFENVQARERTQVLMDIANRENALVVGTGDLSEIALGWNTYNGDHMSMYQLNASVPKTMVLAALRGQAKKLEGRAGEMLAEIASAPITPELVPDAAANDSEARLGPYELHDFFLYHFLANGASREKLLALAKTAFRGKHSEQTVRTARDTFWRRFFAAQYKRNCVPDGPKITLSLSPRADWRMPSDSEMGQFA